MRIRGKIAIAVVLGCVAHAVAVRVASESMASRSLEDDDAIAAVLGDVRVVVGHALYEKADMAFHAGVPHVDCPDGHAGHAINPAHDAHHHDHHHDHDHEMPGAALVPGVPGWIAWIDAQVHPRTHRHLEGHDVQEILPWLAMAIRANPEAAEPYVVAAYWLGWVLHRVDDAETLLRRGLDRAKPRDALARELGRLMLSLRERPDEALPHLRAALDLWDRAAQDDLDPDPDDRAQTLFYLVQCLAALGDGEAARAAARDLLELWPDKPGLREHVAALGVI